MEEGDTLVNALVGAGISVIGSGFVPFAPLLGGAAAAYFQGGDRSDGVRIGLVSGLFALVPAVLVGYLVVGVFGAFLLGVGPGGGGLGFGLFSLLFLLVAFVFGAVYVVGLSTAGGWIGNYVKYDTNLGV